MAIPVNDPFYAAEIVTDQLRDFMRALAAAYGAPRSAIGTRGNRETHFRGAHRSRRFILYSPFCTNRTYTVSRTVGDKTGGTGNEIAGGDLTLPHAALVALCRRVDAAVRSGEFEGLTEWFGQSDNDDQVEGFDNIANAVATSDPSHRWHIHFTFRRDVLRNAAFFARLLAAITEETDMELTTSNPIGNLRQAYIDAGSTPLDSDTVSRLLNLAPLRGLEARKAVGDLDDKLTDELAEIKATLAEIKATPPGSTPIDYEALAAALAPHIAGMTTGVLDGISARMGE